MKSLRFGLLTALFLLFSNAPAAFSQQLQSAPTGLALEVTYYPGRGPTYQSVASAEAKASWSWYALFGRIPSWQPPADSLPVRAVKIAPQVEGDAVRVAVSVFVGVRLHEKELPVATYLIHQNETILTGELSKLGVEPFKLKVTRVSSLSTALPQVTTRAESVAITNIEANDSSLPSFKLQLRNLSNKDIIALGIQLFANNSLSRTGMPHDPEARPLIEAGATYSHNIPTPLNAQSTSAGYAPEVPRQQEIVITTAVFDDGSYEGDAQVAATFRAFLKGDRIQLGKVLPLIQAALNEPDPNVFRAIEKFKASVASLSVEVDADSLKGVQQAFPTLNQSAKAGLKISIEVSLNSVKFDLLKSLQQFEKANAQSLNADLFRAWLSKTEERYARWLERLSLKYAKWLSDDTGASTQ